jgi:hypothetical protein
MENQISSMLPWLIPLIIWDVVWKLIAMWKAARNHHIVWFILLAVLNTVGILPIIYILIYRGKK